MDLSGTMQGAGGVGGLLAIKPTGTNTLFVAYDGNGNVTGVVDATTGTTAGNFEYGPFGETVRLTPNSNNQSPFRFSTKYQDDESDFLYYGFRYYNPSTGRWLSRDPIEERGGRNLYGFVENNPVNRWDVLGRISEGGEWPIPPNSVDRPSGPFSKCRVALRCGAVYRSGIKLGTHCGLIIDTGDGAYALDGSGGTSNRRDVTPANTADATGPWTDNDPSVCECLFANVKPWNDRKVPRDNTCANSNWNLKCGLKKCNLQINWGSQDKPLGYDCKECSKYEFKPKGDRDVRCCTEWREKPCPDQ